MSEPAVVHVIAGLGLGGAEHTLLRLLESVHTTFPSSVVTLGRDGPLSERIRDLGVRVVPLDASGAGSMAARAPRLVSLLRDARPAVVQTWMYHADVIGGMAARLARAGPVVWNVRTTDLDPATEKRTTRAIVRVAAALSRRVPDRIVCNSHAARRAHVRLGYPDALLEVIPNGVAITPGRTDDAASLRAGVGLRPDDVVVGRIGRIAPVKGQLQLVDAIGRLAPTRPALRLVLCGLGADASNSSLVDRIERAGISDRTVLLGPRADVERIHAMLDVACSPSIEEGFPNAVAEAMAAGVPVCATDVGDSSLIVGDCGIIVAPGDIEALAIGVAKLVDLESGALRALGERARARIVGTFDVETMAAAYADLWTGLARR